MKDINDFAIEYGDGVMDVKCGTRGYARGWSGDWLFVWDGVGLCRIPLCRIMLVWKPINR